MSLDLAVHGSAVKTKDSNVASIELRGCSYINVRLLAFENLFWDVNFACEFLRQPKSINIKFGRLKSSLQLATF